jgi:hypothetical protein
MWCCIQLIGVEERLQVTDNKQTTRKTDKKRGAEEQDNSGWKRN